MRHLADNCLQKKQCIFQRYAKGEIWITLRLAADGYRPSPADVLNADQTEAQGNVWCISLLTSKCFINPRFLLELQNLKSQRAQIQVSSPHQPKQVFISPEKDSNEKANKCLLFASNIKISAELCLTCMQPFLVLLSFKLRE